MLHPLFNFSFLILRPSSDDFFYSMGGGTVQPWCEIGTLSQRILLCFSKSVIRRKFSEMFFVLPYLPTLSPISLEFLWRLFEGVHFASFLSLYDALEFQFSIFRKLFRIICFSPRHIRIIGKFFLPQKNNHLFFLGGGGCFSGISFFK